MPEPDYLKNWYSTFSCMIFLDILFSMCDSQLSKSTTQITLTFSNHNEVVNDAGTRSHLYLEPAPTRSNWQPSMPSIELQFCLEVMMGQQIKLNHA